MARLILAGLGPGDVTYVPMPVITAVQRATRVYLRTEKHPAVAALRELRADRQSFDSLYEEFDSFADIYAAITETVTRALSESNGTIVYLTPGHPMVAEATSHQLLEQCQRLGYDVQILPATSSLEAIYAALPLDPLAGLEIIDAYAIEEAPPSGRRGAIILQLHDRLLASSVKLVLLKQYPPETLVTIVRAAGVIGEENLLRLQLHEMDQEEHFDHLTSLYVPVHERAASWDRLLAIVRELRGPTGCPWDKEQDHESLRPYVIEEAYEVIDAIRRQDMYNLKEELGDLLLQVVMHAELATEEGIFDMGDVIDAISQKLIRRHPHVFGGEDRIGRQEAVSRWESIKAAEKGGSPRPSLVDSLKAGPGLLRAGKLQEKVAAVGFDWPSATMVLDKIQEEVHELVAAHGHGECKDVADEIGDVLFSVANYARHARIDPEEALQGTIDKFIERFRFVERAAQQRGQQLSNMSLEEMDVLWNDSKKCHR